MQQNFNDTWRRWATAVIMTTCLVLLAGAATAEEPATDSGAETTSETQEMVVEFGANLRTDLGVRAVRLDVGWRMPSFRLLAVVDPMWWFDGRTTTDLIGFWRTRHLQPLVGWRLQSVPLVDGSQFQHNLVVGTALSFPEFFDGRLGGQWGIEMATMVVKHGGGVAGDRCRADSARHYLDRVSFGMFARFHYNLEL